MLLVPEISLNHLISVGIGVSFGFLLVQRIASICWAIWKTCNAICFERKSVTNPAAIICYACSLMGYWANLFLESDKESMLEGVNTMLAIAMKLVAKKEETRTSPAEGRSR